MGRNGGVNLDVAGRRSAVMKLGPAAGKGESAICVRSLSRQLWGIGDRERKLWGIDHCADATELSLVPVSERPQAEMQPARGGNVDAGHAKVSGFGVQGSEAAS